MVADPQTAYFGVGIKFETLYRQFAGTPVSSDSAWNLERAVAGVVEYQLHYKPVSVHILDGALDAKLAGPTADYTELTGRFMEVEMEIDYEGVRIRTEMGVKDGCPLMKIVSVE